MTETANAPAKTQTARKPRTTKPAGQVRTGNPKEDRAVRDAAAERDAEVLKGLVPEAGSPEHEQHKAATPKPRPARKAPAKAPAAKANGKAPAKPAPAKATGTAKTESTGTGTVSATVRESNQVLARRLVDLVAKEFAGDSPADQLKVANWLKVLPTGGAGWERYWPAGFTRPSTADWRPPAN